MSTERLAKLNATLAALGGDRIVERDGALYIRVPFPIVVRPPKRPPKRREPTERDRLLDALWEWASILRQRGWVGSLESRRANTTRTIETLEGL